MFLYEFRFKIFCANSEMVLVPLEASHICCGLLKNLLMFFGSSLSFNGKIRAQTMIPRQVCPQPSKDLQGHSSGGAGRRVKSTAFNLGLR